jgi:hypothetical protein
MHNRSSIEVFTDEAEHVNNVVIIRKIGRKSEKGLDYGLNEGDVSNEGMKIKGALETQEIEKIKSFEKKGIRRGKG